MNNIEKKFSELVGAWRSTEHASDHVSGYTSGRTSGYRSTAGFPKDGFPKDGWPEATPSFQIQAYQHGKLKIDLKFGKEYRYYDWASLTKIVFSVSSFIFAEETEDLDSQDRLSLWMPEILENLDFGEKKVVSQITLKDLLTHSAGMSWWLPFYKRLEKVTPRLQEDSNCKTDMDLHELLWADLISFLVKDIKKSVQNGDLQKRKQGTAIYSDLDFFLLGEVLRRATLTSFPERWAEVADRLGVRDTFFHVSHPNSFGAGVIRISQRKSATAPTERRVPSSDGGRGALFQGTVHDENARCLLGVAPHAGLFGPIDDLSRYGLLLRALYLEKKGAFPIAARSFVQRALPERKGDFALGFMMPTKGRASCGNQFSLNSVGHTGFTGTSLWYDPQKDLLISILSNRVSPTRENRKFLELRPALHTMVVSALGVD